MRALEALRYMSEGYDNHFNAGTPNMAQEVDKVATRIADLEANVVALKVCIICDHCSGVDDSRWCDEETPWDETVWLYDHCHYTPSRWATRAEEGGEDE